MAMPTPDQTLDGPQDVWWPRGTRLELCLASACGDLNRVQLLLEQSADANSTLPSYPGMSAIIGPAVGLSALHMASQQGHLGVAVLLLHYKADPNVAATGTVGCGETALSMASSKNQVEVVRVLLGRGADPNKARTDTGMTALIETCTENYVEVARLLLEHGADPNKGTTDNGTTALYAASFGGHVEVARLLLECSADPNKARTDIGVRPRAYNHALPLAFIAHGGSPCWDAM